MSSTVQMWQRNGTYVLKTNSSHEGSFVYRGVTRAFNQRAIDFGVRRDHLQIISTTEIEFTLRGLYEALGTYGTPEAIADFFRSYMPKDITHTQEEQVLSHITQKPTAFIPMYAFQRISKNTGTQYWQIYVPGRNYRTIKSMIAQRFISKTQKQEHIDEYTPLLKETLRTKISIIPGKRSLRRLETQFYFDNLVKSSGFEKSLHDMFVTAETEVRDPRCDTVQMTLDHLARPDVIDLLRLHYDWHYPKRAHYWPLVFRVPQSTPIPIGEPFDPRMIPAINPSTTLKQELETMLRT